MRRKKGWSPITRCIRYAPEKVAQACLRRAEQAALDGDVKGEDYWRAKASTVERGCCNIREVAHELLMYAEGWSDD